MQIYIVTEEYSDLANSWTNVSEVFSSRQEAEEYAETLNKHYELTNSEYGKTCFYIQSWLVKEPE